MNTDNYSSRQLLKKKKVKFKKGEAKSCGCCQSSASASAHFLYSSAKVLIYSGCFFLVPFARPNAICTALSLLYILFSLDCPLNFCVL